jgi:hypothetical protein
LPDRNLKGAAPLLAFVLAIVLIYFFIGRGPLPSAAIASASHG